MFDCHFGMPILASRRWSHLAPKRMRDELKPVTDTEYRQRLLQHLRISGRSVRVIHGARPAREDDAYRRITFDLVERCGTRQHDGENLKLADAARNELRVLRA